MFSIVWAGHSGAPFAAAVLAQAEPSGTNPQYWIQWGVIGVMAFLLMSGKFLAPRYVLDRETTRADRMEAALAAQNTMLAEKHLPALADSRAATSASTQALQEALTLLRDIARDRDRDMRRGTE